MTKKEAYFADYNEVEKLIKEKLNIEYEILAGEECSNYSAKRFVIRKKPLDDYDSSKLEELKAGKHPNYCTDILLQVLVNEGHLEPGTYIIDCSW